MRLTKYDQENAMKFLGSALMFVKAVLAVLWAVAHL